MAGSANNYTSIPQHFYWAQIGTNNVVPFLEAEDLRTPLAFMALEGAVETHSHIHFFFFVKLAKVMYFNSNQSVDCCPFSF